LHNSNFSNHKIKKSQSICFFRKFIVPLQPFFLTTVS